MAFYLPIKKRLDDSTNDAFGGFTANVSTNTGEVQPARFGALKDYLGGQTSSGTIANARMSDVTRGSASANAANTIQKEGAASTTELKMADTSQAPTKAEPQPYAPPQPRTERPTGPMKSYGVGGKEVTFNKNFVAGPTAISEGDANRYGIGNAGVTNTNPLADSFSLNNATQAQKDANAKYNEYYKNYSKTIGAYNNFSNNAWASTVQNNINNHITGKTLANTIVPTAVAQSNATPSWIAAASWYAGRDAAMKNAQQSARPWLQRIYAQQNAIYSDETLKQDISEMSADEINKIINDLSNGVQK